MRIRKRFGQNKNNCSKCGKPLEKSRKSKQRYCKSCHAEYMRLNRVKHSDLSGEQKLKSNARSYLRVYIKRGKVTKMPCEVCKDVNSEAHHEDYSKPLDVKWLCRKHHLELHKAALT